MKKNKYVFVDDKRVEIRNPMNNKLVSIVDNDIKLIKELKRFFWQTDIETQEAVSYVNGYKYYVKNIVYLFYHGIENALDLYYAFGGDKISEDWVRC